MRATILVALAIAGASTARAETPPSATIETGTVIGASRDGVASWKGIPFALPPVGPLRWRAPQPAASWTGPRDATRYAADCMQKPFDSDAAPLGTTPAEDCLYLNVWRPAPARGGLPVLVWIYGGGFVNGGSSPPTYAGAALARRGIVFVSFNYRIGRFGAFGHPALTAADADGGKLVDYGFMDQLAALRWVRRNVAAFGGDPAKVTIVGESAGGMAVHMLMTAPDARGLFRAAVIQSGGDAELNAPTSVAEAAGVAFARKRGIADGPNALDELRALPADRIVDGLNLASFGTPETPPTYVGPVSDGRLAVAPLVAYRAGRFARVPVMIGATSDDIGGPDGVMATGARTVAGLIAAGAPVYAYRFSYVAASARTPATKGAAHATDIPFFFDTADVKYGAATTATDRRAARQAADYLVAFVKTGDPNAPGLPRWPRFDPATPELLDLDAAGGATVETAR